MNKYLKGKDRGQSKRSSAYLEAVKVIRREKRQDPLQPITAPRNQPLTTSSGDNFSFLDNSYSRVKKDLATFTEVEVSSRLSALKEENRVLREELRSLQKEVERLKKDEPRTVDWIDALQDKFTKEET